MDENAILSGNITLDMVYHPELAQTWHIYQYCVFVLSSIMVAITFYAISKKSTPDMGIYKSLLLNQLAWSYLFDLSLTIWQPVSLLPYFMAYSAGISKIVGPNSQYIMFCVTYFMYGGLIQSIVVAMLFRVSRVHKATWNLYDDEKVWWKIGGFVLAVTEILIFIPVFIWAFSVDTDVESVRTHIIHAEPIMSTIFLLEPSSNGFDWNKGRYILIVGCIDYGIILLTFSAILLSCTFIFIQKMKRLKSTTTTTTYRLQIMLFKTLLVQTTLIFMTIALPVILMDYLLFTRNPYGSCYMQIALFLWSLHGIADTFTILAFIKPYRKFVMQKIGRSIVSICEKMIG